MKKTSFLTIVVTLALVLTTIIGNTIPVKAAEDDGEIRLDSMEFMDLESYEAENQRVYALGQSVMRQRTASINAISNFPALKQYDARWKDIVMGNSGLTIGSSGCCLTSFTMIQQYYGGTDDPAGVNSTLGAYACPFYYYVAGDRYGLKITTFVSTATSYSDTLNYVVGAISENHPVMIGMTNNAGGTHYVVAFGYAYNHILIRDTAGDTSGTEYLSDYTDDGYYVDRIIIYEIDTDN